MSSQGSFWGEREAEEVQVTHPVMVCEEDLTCIAGPLAKECGQPPEAGKGKKQILLSAQKGTQPC